MTRPYGRNGSQDLMNTLYMMDRMDAQRAGRAENERQNREQEFVKRQEQGRKDAEQDEKETARTFQEVAGVKLDDDTRKYAGPVEEAVTKRNMQARTHQRSEEERQRQLQQNQPRGLLSLFKSAPKDEGPTTVPPSELNKEELKSKVVGPAKQDTRNFLENAGVIGDHNRENPAFDENAHKFFYNESSPLVPAGKALEHVKGMSLARQESAKAKKEAVGARIAENTEKPFTESYNTQAAEAAKQSVLKTEVDQWAAAYTPKKLQQEELQRSLQTQLTAGQIAEQPQIRQHREMQMQKIQGEIRKQDEEFNRTKLKGEIAAQWAATTDPAQKLALGRQILALDGHYDKIEQMDESKKQNAIRNLNDAVGFSVEASKQTALANKARLEGKNPEEMMSRIQAANIAAIRAAELSGSDQVTTLTGRYSSNYLSGYTMDMGSIKTSRDYALAKTDGSLQTRLTAKIPDNIPISQQEMLAADQATLHYYVMLEQNPELAKDPKAALQQINSMPQVQPLVKQKMKEVVEKFAGIKAQKEQEQALTLGSQRNQGLSEQKMNEPGETGAAKIGRMFTDPIPPGDPRREKALPPNKRTGLKSLGPSLSYSSEEREKGLEKRVQSEEENRFQRWYKDHAEKLGLNPNPDAPEHKYDYRAAFKAGIGPDEQGHWPSRFKANDHPNRFINGKDTKSEGASTPESNTFRTTKEAVGKAFAKPEGQLPSKVKGASFEEWVAVQLKRSGQTPDQITAPYLKSIWDLWSKHN